MIETVLLVEDNPGDARLLREMFNDYGSRTTELTRVACMAEAEAYLAGQSVSVILLDLDLPDAQGLAVVRRAQVAAPGTPLVVLTGLDDESMAAQAVQEGAEDYLIKGQIVSRGLMRALQCAIERKAMQEALFAEKERAQMTLNCIGDAVVCTDLAGRITFLNLVAETMSGWQSQEANGHPLGEVFRVIEIASGYAVLDEPGICAAHLHPMHILPSTCNLIRRDGTAMPIDATIASIHDRKGRSTGAVVVLRDGTAVRDITRQITHAAQHDFLTGLPNRVLLYDRIGQAIAYATRHDAQVAILFLDLDGFKHINDSLGHLIGDKLLQSVAQRLVGSVRASDTVCRQGGDEFIILLTEMKQPGDAIVMGRRLLAAVAEAHGIDRHDLHVTASIGVSVYPDDALDAETLIKNADTAMYHAKENGRQSCHFFKAAMNVRAVERQFIEEGLRRALERREFILHYQPKVDVKTGAITGAEALIRWMHPIRGLLMPNSFIQVAEECGLIVPIGAWVLQQACEQVCLWAQAGLGETSIAVNVSAIEFRAEKFLDGVFAALEATGLAPRLLELELTESVLMKHVDATTATLQRLRDCGIRIAIDDFGTGYSSLSYLGRFHVDTIKIDQSFVRQIGAGGDDMHIVGAVIGMARTLNLLVVAEGVERVEELAFLRASHCDEAQGYYFSRPVPADQFAALLKTGLPFDPMPLEGDVVTSGG